MVQCTGPTCTHYHHHSTVEHKHRRGKMSQSGSPEQPRILHCTRSEEPLPPIPRNNLAILLLQEIAQYGDKVALVEAESGRSHTFADLCSLVPRISGGLVAAGVSQGDAVLVLTRNNIDYPPLLFGILLTEATCVPANPDLKPAELVHIVKVSGARWLIVQEGSVATAESLLSLLPPNTFRNIWVLGKNDKRPTVADLMKAKAMDPVVMSDDFDPSTAVALMPFSSGTTGMPKGVMLSHRNLIVAYLQAKVLMNLMPEGSPNYMESSIIILPMYHIYAYTSVIYILVTGNRGVIMARFAPEQYLKAIQDYKVSYSPIVPHIAQFLTETPLLEKYDLSSLLAFGSGAAPLASSTLMKLMEKTGSVMGEGYGLTETCAPVASAGGPAGFRPGSVGTMLPYVEGKVVDPESGAMLGMGQEGELCFRGPAIMLGYASNPEATAAAIDPEGWFHTGDLGYFDEDEFIFITDRKKDLMKVKGYQVAPSELEKLLREVEGVSDVAVVGIPNVRLGEAPRAWVVPSPGTHLDPQALQKYVEERVVSYKQLAGGVTIVDSLPKNHLGKILKRQLKNEYIPPSKL